MELEVNFPDYEKGAEIDLGGILVINGKTTTVSEDQELAFVGRWGKPVRDKLDGNKNVKVTGQAKYTPSAVAELGLAEEGDS